jgi:predicted anti-sigma-YlaC factor YlaD
VVLLEACSPRHLILHSLAGELASQGNAPEDDLVLAREASAFYLKLSESVLRETPDNLALAETVASGFTQYAYAYVQSDADRTETKDASAAHRLRQRAARLYHRAQRHALSALEIQTPGFTKALESTSPADWPHLRADQIGVAYWAAASWGAWIAMSKDQPDIVADLPLAIRLAELAWHAAPAYGNGSLASLMGTFEANRPGGSAAQATLYFDQAITLGAGRNAGVLVAKAEAVALPAGDRPAFENLLKQALAASELQRDLSNLVMRERALWLLESAEDLF